MLGTRRLAREPLGPLTVEREVRSRLTRRRPFPLDLVECFAAPVVLAEVRGLVGAGEHARAAAVLLAHSRDWLLPWAREAYLDLVAQGRG